MFIQLSSDVSEWAVIPFREVDPPEYWTWGEIGLKNLLKWIFKKLTHVGKNTIEWNKNLIVLLNDPKKNTKLQLV